MSLLHLFSFPLQMWLLNDSFCSICMKKVNFFFPSSVDLLAHSGPTYCQNNRICNEKKKKKRQILFFLISLWIWNKSWFTAVWIWLKAELCVEIFVGFQGCSKYSCSPCVKIYSPEPKEHLNPKRMYTSDVIWKIISLLWVLPLIWWNGDSGIWLNLKSKQ